MERNKAWRNQKTTSAQQRQLNLLHSCKQINKHTVSPKIAGRMKTLSYYDCGRPKCGLCNSGSRSDKWASKQLRLSMQERKRFQEKLIDLVLEGNE